MMKNVMRWNSATVCAQLVVLLSFSCFTGCTTIRVTDPPRTASEQFLMSEAAALAVGQLSFESLSARKVFVETTYFAAEAKAFVIGQLRGSLLGAGVTLVDTKDQAEIILEVRSRSVGIDRHGSLVGIPSIPLPAFAAASPVASVTTPELPLFKKIKQHGFASIAFISYWRDSGEIVSSSGPFVGRTMREDFWFFGFGPRTVGNIPTAKHLMKP